MSDDPNEIRWTRPLHLTQWAVVFSVNRGTLRKWFRDQKIQNEQMSPRKWRVRYSELPGEIVQPLIARQRTVSRSSEQSEPRGVDSERG